MAIYGSRLGNKLLTRMRLGRTYLNSHGFAIQKVKSPSCMCHFNNETPTHYLQLFLVHCWTSVFVWPGESIGLHTLRLGSQFSDIRYFNKKSKNLLNYLESLFLGYIAYFYIYLGHNMLKKYNLFVTCHI